MSAQKGYLPDTEEGLRFFPEQASTFAGDLDFLFIGLVAVCAVMTLLVFGLIVAFTYRYHASRQKPREALPSARTSHRIELSVLGAMFVIFMGLFAWSTHLYLDLYRGPEAAMTINVVGKQWMWKVQHPDGVREINTLHVPVGETIELRLTSEDVIHSFYIPDYRIKHDAVPGTYRKLWFEATKPGQYRLFCAEYCGSYHSRMRGKIIALDPADYQRWLDDQGERETPEVRGASLFRSYGCSGCHLGSSNVRAPSLAGVYGRPVPLASGGTVMADEAYLRDSILQPQKHVVAGFSPIMPSYSGQIDEGEILSIIAYLQSLEPEDQALNPSDTTRGSAMPEGTAQGESP
ncbi:cytochrome c oxidase subunit 2 [Modicisalibacter ilicicola DSM 19980]|uniref:cytochrome-c oxidase n=1 Tax=Modicisalibacter ilicicola DSM 19980 TaxID=1121942 RepID=A0A1M5CJ57_9GAMM|nr:cytochrome c oxidase subunit II [Halomonas ilicicola]SHF54617.1 cytochrome c oxidase subunit 2 [Halomonas ilicicola DSM 19980]